VVCGSWFVVVGLLYHKIHILQTHQRLKYCTLKKILDNIIFILLIITPNEIARGIVSPVMSPSNYGVKPLADCTKHHIIAIAPQSIGNSTSASTSQVGPERLYAREFLFAYFFTD